MPSTHPDTNPAPRRRSTTPEYPLKSAEKLVQVQGTWFDLKHQGRSDAAKASLAVMPLRECVQALPGNELMRDLPLERDAVGTLSGHGFHPLKAQLTLSNH
jgi:hypothetical protein